MTTLEARHISKRFGAVQALRDVSIRFSPGEVHGVLGENGAGKSTLMNVLAGFLTPDSGETRFNDAVLHPGNPRLCKRLGIEMIHQHFALAPALTVVENIALAGVNPTLQSWQSGPHIERSMRAAKSLNWDIPWKAQTKNLPVGAQQRVEILKALGGNAKALIFDEPTAVLTPAEVDQFFALVRDLKGRGMIVVLIAHKLSEILAIADRVTVLRQGEFVASALRADVDKEQLAEWMVGKLPERSGVDDVGAEGAETALSVHDLTVEADRKNLAVNGVSFDVRRGEVLGIGGVDGNGQTELAEALVGIRPVKSGSVSFALRGANAAKVGYIPQDRRTGGLALEMSVIENLMIEGHRKQGLSFLGLIRRRKAEEWAKGLVETYGISIGGLGDTASSLSGGNQQKVVVSRNLDAHPDLLVAMNPTRGLDFNATVFVHDAIRRAKAGGAGIVLISTDLDELKELSDRMLFLSRGRAFSEVSALGLLGEEAT